MHISVTHNILWSKYKGGVFSELHRLVAESEHQITFVQIAETEGERVSLGGVDLRYHRYPYKLLFKGSYSATPKSQRVWALLREAVTTTADLVILPGYERLEYWAMLMVLALRGIPRAVFCDSTAYDRPPNRIKAMAKRLFFSRCDGFFGYGERSKEYLLSLGARPDRIFFRCQAAALPLDYDETTALAMRAAKAPRPEEAPRFVYVGRISHEKGLDTLIDAMANFCKRHAGASLKIIGGGPLQESLVAKVAALGLQGNVSFPGSMSIQQLADEYASSTAMVLPSTSEPWGLVVNEALSYGCPVVVSHICGCVPELVIADRTGFSFQTRDINALEHALDQVTQMQRENVDLPKYCVEHMRRFSPTRAAEQILIGSAEILQRASHP